MENLQVTNCEKCLSLTANRTQIVNGVGPEDADILLIGEGPGRNEDEQGLPFVGKSGKILDEILEKNDLTRGDNVRITNAVRCRPPNNRDPKSGELENCKGYLYTEIQRVDPSVIVTLGRVPSQHLLDRDVKVTSESGNVATVTIDGNEFKVLISVHPAAITYDSTNRERLEKVIKKSADYL